MNARSFVEPAYLKVDTFGEEQRSFRIREAAENAGKYGRRLVLSLAEKVNGKSEKYNFSLNQTNLSFLLEKAGEDTDAWEDGYITVEKKPYKMNDGTEQTGLFIMAFSSAEK